MKPTTILGDRANYLYYLPDVCGGELFLMSEVPLYGAVFFYERCTPVVSE